jgi:hypothetical protein
MKPLNLDFGLQAEVIIKSIPGKEGVIIGIHLDGEGLQYKVRYFCDGDPKEVYFYAWELEEA